MLIKNLKNFALFLIIILAIIFYLSLDKNKKKNEINGKLKLKLSYFENNRIDDLEIKFGKKTTRHFLVMGSLVEQADFEKYNALNTWKKIKIKSEGRELSAKMKRHGRVPDNHSNGFIYHSYSIKLGKNETINGYRNFKLVVNKRLDGSKKILALSKILNIFSIPVFPVKVKFNNKYNSEYLFIPKIDRFFSEKNGKATYYFFSENDKNKSYKEQTLKSLLFNAYSSDVKNYQVHLQSLEKKLKKNLTSNFKFGDNLDKQIITRFNNLNSVIFKKDYSKALEFFEKDYIVNYLLALIISAENGHQNVYANQQIAYDVATGFFYPFVNWDSQSDVKRYTESKSHVLEIMQNYGENTNLPLLSFLTNNEIIKKQLVLRIPEFINQLKNTNSEIQKELLEDINKENYIHYLEKEIKKIPFGKTDISYFKYENLFRKKNSLARLGKLSLNKFVFNSGKHLISENLVFPKNIDVVIQPNTEIILKKSISIIIYGSLDAQGTREYPIHIRSENNESFFGSFAITGGQQKNIKIKYLNISNSSEAKINGQYLSGGLSLYQFKDIDISNLNITGSNGQDGLNIKYASKCNLENIVIINAKYDAIDIDSCGSVVGNNIILNNSDNKYKKDENGDGFDFSYSKANLKNIKVNGFRDKGISVGEYSVVSLEESLIYDNNIGIAVKDNSCLSLLRENKFKNNYFDLSLYKKKNNYGSGVLILADKANLKIFKDDKSKIIYQNSKKCLESDQPFK